MGPFQVCSRVGCQNLHSCTTSFSAHRRKNCSLTCEENTDETEWQLNKRVDENQRSESRFVLGDGCTGSAATETWWCPGRATKTARE